ELAHDSGTRHGWRRRSAAGGGILPHSASNVGRYRASSTRRRARASPRRRTHHAVARAARLDANAHRADTWPGMAALVDYVKRFTSGQLRLDQSQMVPRGSRWPCPRAPYDTMDLTP